MKRQTIPVVFATDDNYAPYCGVAISSLIANASSDNQYDIYVLYDRLANKNIYKLEGLSIGNIKVTCRPVHDYIPQKMIMEHIHLSVATTYRLVIPDILPQFDKVLYLDSDIVVNTDVAELYDTDISNNIFGAVRGYCKRGKTDFLFDHLTKTLGINIDNFFFAGILLFNISEFVNKNISEKCFTLLAERQDLFFMDQDALNIACEGNIFFLPDRWNLDWNYLRDIYNPASSSSRGKIESQADRAIIHFIGGEKPWDYPEQMFSDYFWNYARQTIFYEEILLSMQTRRMAKMLDLLKLIGRGKNIAVYGAGTAGRKYVSDILSFNLHNIVIWVDRNFADRTGYELPVESVEKLFCADFDCVLIAIEYVDISNEVKDVLIAGGVSEDKIVQISR